MKLFPTASALALGGTLILAAPHADAALLVSDAAPATNILIDAYIDNGGGRTDLAVTNSAATTGPATGRTDVGQTFEITQLSDVTGFLAEIRNYEDGVGGRGVTLELFSFTDSDDGEPDGLALLTESGVLPGSDPGDTLLFEFPSIQLAPGSTACSSRSTAVTSRRKRAPRSSSAAPARTPMASSSAATVPATSRR